MLEELKLKMREYRTWLIVAFVAFFAIHMVQFTNYYPCWDTYSSLQMDVGHMRNIGRWAFAPFTIILSSAYDLEWVGGVFSAIFVSFSSIIMIDLWEIRKSIGRFIIIFLTAAFPSMTAAYVYMFTSPAYMFAFFLAMFSIYLSIRSKFAQGTMISTVCIIFSLALYQAYLLAAVGVFLLYICKSILQQKTVRIIFNDIKQYVICCLGGGGLYKVIDICYQKIAGYELSNYQGVSEIGELSFSQFPQAAEKVISKTIEFYMSNHWGTYRSLNIIIVILTLVIIIRYIVINNKLSIQSRIILVLLFFSLSPLTYAYYFLSPNVDYHRIMEFGDIFLYFIPLLIFEHSRTDDFNRKQLNYCLKFVCLGMLLVLGLYHFRNDNIIYKQLEVYAERTRYETYEIIQKIDSEYGAGTKNIAITGFFRFEPRDYKIEAEPDTVGIMRNFHAVPQSFVNFARFYYARNYYLAPNDAIEKIKKTEEYKTMDRYPFGNYIKEIDGIIVINL